MDDWKSTPQVGLEIGNRGGRLSHLSAGRFCLKKCAILLLAIAF